MRLLRHAVLAVLAAQPMLAQAQTTASGPTLTLEQAISVAQQNNPLFLQTANGRRTADAQVRSAYGSLLPAANASFSGRYQQGGQQVFNGLSFSSNSDAVQSSYNLGVSYSINLGTLTGLRAARANRRAADADVTGAAEILRSDVAQQYLTVLQSQARAALEDTLVITAQAQLDLAKARTAAGMGTSLDVARAEVALGQAQVAALTAHNNAEVEMLRLFQQMGVPEPDSVALTTNFGVEEPHFSLDSLLTLARRGPVIEALRARSAASAYGVKVAHAAYTPTLSLSTGWGGQTYQYTDPNYVVQQAQFSAMQQYGSCMMFDSLRTGAGLAAVGCGSPTLSDAQVAAIKNRNQTFPFKFTKAPLSMYASLSIPVFDNFAREQRVEEAQVQRDNAQLSLRARELQLTADVTQAYRTVVTAARTVALQQQNADKAREELAYAEERYKVGAATFLDVITSRSTFEQAQIDRINAIYDYHKAFAALESAVGRPLR